MAITRTTALALAALLTLTALLAGCGGSSDKPASPSALVTDSAKAVRAQKPARFNFNAQARADQVVPAAGASDEIRQLSSSPSSLGLSGAFSPEAIQAKGSAQLGGQTFTAEALAGAREAYVKFLGGWYGTKETGLEELRRQAEQQGGKSSDQAFSEAISNIERYGKDVFQGEVTEGPELEGAATWRTEGTLNADGLVKLAQDQGEQVKPEDREVLEKVAQGTTLTYVVGQDDKLPRRLRLAFDLKPSEFAGAATQGDEELKQIERVKASFSVDMSKWGEPVEITPPRDFQPLEQLLSQFLGGAAPQPQQ